MATVSFAGATTNTLTVNYAHNGSAVNNYITYLDGVVHSKAPFTQATSHSFQKTYEALEPDKSYVVRVEYFRNSLSVHSAQASYKTKALPPPSGKPQINSAIASAGRKITVSWTGVSDATGYHVFADGTHKTSTPATSASFFVNNEWTEYSITVTPYNAGGSGVSSASYPVRTLDETPPSVNGIMTFSQITDTSIRVSAEAGYDAGSGIKGYRVYRQVGKGTSNLTHVTTINGTSGFVDITDLTENTLYTFAIRAFDNSNNHNQTTDVVGEIITQASTPSAPIVTERIDGGFVIQWGSVSGANQYQLEFKPTVNQVWQSRTTTATSTTLILGQWGLQYDLRVRASKNNGSAWGGYSGTNIATTNPKTPKLLGNYANGTATFTFAEVSGSFSVLIVDRYLRANNALVDSKTTTMSGGSVSWTINSGIQQYYFRARARLDVSSTSLYGISLSNTVQFDRPESFDWTYAGCSLSPPFDPIPGKEKIQSLGFYVTAEEWNRLIQKVLAFRSYSGLGPYTCDSAIRGDPLLAKQFNQVRAAIAAMRSTGLPSSKDAGDTITAKDFNDLVACLNAIQ